LSVNLDMHTLILGASSGIGLEVCKRLLDQPDHHVVGLSRSASTIGNANFTALQLDVTCQKNYGKFLEVHDFSLYTNFVYCVGHNFITHLGGIDNNAIQAHYNLNLFPFIMLASAIFRSRSERHPSSVVAVGSIWSSFGIPGRSLYGSSKSALAGFVKHASTELSIHNCSINVISPGFTDTGLTSNTIDDPLILSKFNRVSGRRLMDPSHVAAHIVSLLQPFNYCITGSEVFVDLGFSNHA